jgi:hypothetical protein
VLHPKRLSLNRISKKKKKKKCPGSATKVLDLQYPFSYPISGQPEKGDEPEKDNLGRKRITYRKRIPN